MDMAEKWKSSNAEISELSGSHLKKDADESESDGIEEIVEDWASRISEEYLCGIDFAVEEIYKKLSMESNDIRAVGICGMPGIGKTTTAKVLYSRYSNKFDISCFFENVKQYYSEGGTPLLPLLEQLLIRILERKDYKVPDVESGLRQLEQILCYKKTLIVLDDLDISSYSELLLRLHKLFSAGSRIIITTRYADLIHQLKVDFSEADMYMVKELGQKASLELFSYHAFGKTLPPVSFAELSVSLVTYAGGHPLTLKVLGSSLCGRTHVSYWEAKLEKVRKTENNIKQILQLSYDELNEKEKSIFLDIVFFFVGKDKDETAHVFKSCDFFPDAGIPVLVERCLLRIDEDNKFRMHNLIQDMGREVIREESRYGKCRHLNLCQGNALEDLQNLEGTDNIESLVLDLTMWTQRHVSAKIFERLPNLRLLEIIGAHDIRGNFKNSFHELRLIRWHHCPWTCLPSSFRPQKLVSVEMTFSKLKTLWKGTMPSVSLNTINVSYSKNLKTTPDFRDSKLVEKFLLRGCKSLLKVHPSLGQLSDLSHLDLGECNSLRDLPRLAAQLTKLGNLDLRSCHSLKRLPEPIIQLSYLDSLNVSGCCSLKQLPEQLGDIKGLKMLDVSYTALEQLPDSVARLIELVDLKLISCKKLRTLPEQFGNMEALRMFDASSSAIEELPDSFGRLISLSDLKLSNCQNLVSLPNSIWKLKLLKLLDLSSSSKLERLPEQLEKMLCLEYLNASSTAIEEVPDSIGLLSRLRLLNLNSCQKLKYLSHSIWELASLANLNLHLEGTINIDLPDSINIMKLECLSLQCNTRLWLPMILNFSSLKRLTLKDEGQGFASTKSCSLSNLLELQYLALENCTNLGSFPELPPNVTVLSLYMHAIVQHLPDLSRLKQLRRLYIEKYISLQSLPPLPPCLQSLEVHSCTSLQEIPDLSMLKELNTLSFIQCRNLKCYRLEQSSIKVGRDNYSSFTADLPNREIAEWFSSKSHGCTVSLKIPQSLGDNFLGVALWVVYTCKTTNQFNPYIKAVITNKTELLKKNYRIYAHTNAIGEVNSRVECISGDAVSVKSGDRIKVSFQSLLRSTCAEGEEVPAGKVKVLMCGAHVIQKTPSSP